MVSDDEWNRNIRNTIKQRRPGTTEEELDLLDSSSSYWGAENYQASAIWSATSLRLIEDPKHLPNSLIFINLNGLLEDIPKFLKDKAKIFSMFGITDDDSANAFIATNTNQEMREHFQLLWDSSRNSAAIRSFFTEDDLFMLNFMRHRYCHPILSGYSVKIDGLLGDSKFKVEKWKRLIELGSITKEEVFKLEIIAKLKTIRTKIETLVNQLQLMSR